MRFRLALSLAVAALVLTASAACTPDPAPTPTPTGFATEEEAFAAAEQTYREYVDAINARAENPNSSPDPLDYLISTALEDEIDAQRELERDGLRLAGMSKVSSIRPTGSSESDAISKVLVVVCTDFSQVRVLDSEGNDVTPADRPNYPLDVTMTLVDGELFIANSQLNEVDSC